MTIVENYTRHMQGKEMVIYTSNKKLPLPTELMGIRGNQLHNIFEWKKYTNIRCRIINAGFSHTKMRYELVVRLYGITLLGEKYSLPNIKIFLSWQTYAWTTGSAQLVGGTSDIQLPENESFWGLFYPDTHLNYIKTLLTEHWHISIL